MSAVANAAALAAASAAASAANLVDAAGVPVVKPAEEVDESLTKKPEPEDRKRYRDDKQPAEADTVDAVRELFRQQTGAADA